MTTSRHPCACSAAGYCPQHDTVMYGRAYQCCRGESGETAEREAELLTALVAYHRKINRPPTWRQQVRNYLLSVLRRIQHHWRTVSARDLQARLNLCRACDRNVQGRCRECGCPVRKKARWAAEQCPLSKWPTIQAATVQQCGGCGS